MVEWKWIGGFGAERVGRVDSRDGEWCGAIEI